MIFLIAAALSGAAVTCAMLWHYGFVIVLLGATFGGSLSALLAGFVLALLRLLGGESARNRHLLRRSHLR
jgi:hypothetical protein